MKQWINRSLAALLALSLLAGCSQTAPGDASSVPQQETSASEAEPTIPEPPQPEPEPPTETDAVSLLLQNMTLREKVGQLFLVRPDALDLSQTEDQIEDPAGAGVTELSGAMADTLAQYPVGGLVLFGKNIASPEQTTNFIRDMQAASGTPLFIAVDEEGGLVAGLPTTPPLRSGSIKARPPWGRAATSRRPWTWVRPSARICVNMDSIWTSPRWPT